MRRPTLMWRTVEDISCSYDERVLGARVCVCFVEQSVEAELMSVRGLLRQYAHDNAQLNSTVQSLEVNLLATSIVIYSFRLLLQPLNK